MCLCFVCSDSVVAIKPPGQKNERQRKQNFTLGFTRKFAGDFFGSSLGGPEPLAATVGPFEPS